MRWLAWLAISFVASGINIAMCRLRFAGKLQGEVIAISTRSPPIRLDLPKLQALPAEMPMSMFAAFRPALSAGVLATLAACTIVSANGGNGGRMIDDGQEFAMHPGEQVSLADHSTLHYVRVTNDSRCPPGVKCIWAGDAEVALQWTATNAAAQAFSLHTGKDPKQQIVGERRLTLLSLARGDAPEAQLRIERSP
jgi:hypothetical protein